jgi:hypothetical protein
VKTLNLIEGSFIKISSDVKNDESEEKDEKKDEKKNNNGFMRIKDLEVTPRRHPLKQFLRYIINISSDKETPPKRLRRSSYARKALKKLL